MAVCKAKRSILTILRENSVNSFCYSPFVLSLEEYFLRFPHFYFNRVPLWLKNSHIRYYITLRFAIVLAEVRTRRIRIRMVIKNILSKLYVHTNASCTSGATYTMVTHTLLLLHSE